VLEEKNSELIENFKEEQKFHNEKIEDMLSKIEKSRKYQETEKEKYKKKIQTLLKELPESQARKFEESSDSEDETEEEESEVVTIDEETPHAPLEKKTSVESALEIGPCEHNSSGQHPDLEFSSDSDFDLEKFDKTEPPRRAENPKFIVRRKTKQQI